MKLLLISLFLIVMNIDPSPITLEDLQWKNRVVLIFPGEDAPPGLDIDQSSRLDEELADRDLIYFHLGDTLSGNSEYVFTPAYREKLTSRYAMGTKLSCYVLIGKDGGVKLKREQAQVDWKELFSTIDAMPMRIREMKERDNREN